MMIDSLVKSKKYNEAFTVVEDRVTFLSTHIKPHVDILSRRIQNIAKLAKMGFSLKDKNTKGLKEQLDQLKSDHVENKVSELAHRKGYTEKEEREWACMHENALDS